MLFDRVHGLVERLDGVDFYVSAGNQYEDTIKAGEIPT